MMKERTAMKGKYRFTLADASTGEVKWVREYENLIPQAVRDVMANQLVLAVPTSLLVTDVLLGTSAVPPSSTDTGLLMEVNRKAPSSLTWAGNTVYISAFYTGPELSGSFREAGVLIDPTNNPAVALLLSRVAIVVDKTVNETLAIDYTITFN